MPATIDPQGAARVRRFFFYGTLQPGTGTRMAGWLEPRFGTCTPASVPGTLFAVSGGNGWYPALVTGRSGERAQGTLCEVRLERGDLARLDRYEGHEYRRALLPVLTADGRRTCAQAYVWLGALPNGARPIAGGDFLVWLRATRRRAFTTRRNGI